MALYMYYKVFTVFLFLDFSYKTEARRQVMHMFL